jgi:choline dehydrogenase-like flavoprotein
MTRKIYDAIVVGTGAGGGMAIKALCEAGLEVCALNSGRRLDPAKDFRNHRKSYDMQYRGFGDPKRRDQYYTVESEYTDGLWEHGITYTTAPGTVWEWPRCHAVGGKTNFWGRSSARFAEMDFRAWGMDGTVPEWPLTYGEIAPYYSRVERHIGVASTVQNRPWNPDGEYLPPMKFRCLDHILASAAETLGVPYLPDRIAQLTVPHHDHPPCHFCGHCTHGCDTGSFFSTPYFFLPDAEKTGKLELRENAVAKNVLVDENSRAKGVAYVNRKTKQEVEVYGRAVVLAASCVETARIMLNSKSRHWPTGIANSSGELGKNLCDHLYGTSAAGFLMRLRGAPPFPDNVSNSTIAWMPRWQNLRDPHEENFIGGYAVYPGGGCGDFPWFARHLEGFGSHLKREIKRYYPTPASFTCQVPSLPSPANFVDIDPEVKDIFGIPVARIHFQWGPNELLMWEHSKEVCGEILRRAGGEPWASVRAREPGEIIRYGEPAAVPQTPGFSLHETGVCRMGNDPKKFVTNRWGQCHDVPNLFCCDASVFPFCTDKTTTLSIMAFTLRTCEYLVEQMKKRNI